MTSCDHKMSSDKHYLYLSFLDNMLYIWRYAIYPEICYISGDMLYIRRYAIYPEIYAIYLEISYISRDILYIWRYAIYPEICYISGDMLYIWRYAIFLKIYFKSLEISIFPSIYYILPEIYNIPIFSGFYPNGTP